MPSCVVAYQSRPYLCCHGRVGLSKSQVSARMFRIGIKFPYCTYPYIQPLLFILLLFPAHTTTSTSTVVISALISSSSSTTCTITTSAAVTATATTTTTTTCTTTIAGTCPDSRIMSNAQPLSLTINCVQCQSCYMRTLSVIVVFVGCWVFATTYNLLITTYPQCGIKIGDKKKILTSIAAAVDSSYWKWLNVGLHTNIKQDLCITPFIFPRKWMTSS